MSTNQEEETWTNRHVVRNENRYCLLKKTMRRENNGQKRTPKGKNLMVTKFETLLWEMLNGTKYFELLQIKSLLSIGLPTFATNRSLKKNKIILMNWSTKLNIMTKIFSFFTKFGYTKKLSLLQVSDSSYLIHFPLFFSSYIVESKKEYTWHRTQLDVKYPRTS